MKPSPRSLAVDLLDRIEKTGAYAEPLLDACLQSNALNNPQDRSLLTSLVYGTLRMRGHLDWVIKQFYQGNFYSMQEGIRNIIRTALFQFLFMERIPVFALVDEAVELAKHRYPGRERLVNALLRNAVRKAKNGGFSYPAFEKNPEEHIVVVHSHPSWLVRRWIKIYGPERTRSLCMADNHIPPASIRVNTLKATRASLAGILNEEGITVCESTFSPDGLLLTESPQSVRSTSSGGKGLFVFQDEASQLIAHLVEPKAGGKILDLCCGSGIKTTHLAALMNNEGGITAVDIYPAKLETLNRLSNALGISIIKPFPMDAAADNRKFLQGDFDRILVDAPCSGLGTLRRNPEIKWRLDPGAVSSFVKLQERILNQAASLLRPGGRLVYSTCTMLPEENEDLVKKFLRSHNDFYVIKPSDLPFITREFIDDEGFFRTAPDTSGMDGFFAAILVRR